MRSCWDGCVDRNDRRHDVILAHLPKRCTRALLRLAETTSNRPLCARLPYRYAFIRRHFASIPLKVFHYELKALPTTIRSFFSLLFTYILLRCVFSYGITRRRGSGRQERRNVASVLWKRSPGFVFPPPRHGPENYNFNLLFGKKESTINWRGDSRWSWRANIYSSTCWLPAPKWP